MAGWAYFIWTGDISTIWPMFGIANQLLAAVALALGTTVIINIGTRALRVGHVPPALFRGDDDADGRLSERARQLLADGDRPQPGAQLARLRQSICTVTMMICAVVILGATARRCRRVLSGVLPTLEPTEA